MIVVEEKVRNRIVKGWAFMDLSEEEVAAIRRFLASGDTDALPPRFQRRDYSIYEGRN